MDEFKISFDSIVGYSSKPPDSYVGSISNRVGKIVKNLTPANIKEYVEYISTDGHTFCPSTFRNGKRDKENFEQQQLLVLDFDNKDPLKTISFEEVKARADHYELPILFAYDTLSSQNQNKYRVVFLNDNPVTEIMASELMLKGLTTIFPEVDPICKSSVQMYFGGKELLYFDDSLPSVSIESVIRNTINCLEERHEANHYGRYVEKFFRDAGVSLNGKKQPDVSIEENPAEASGANDGKNLQNSIIYVPFGRKFPKSYYRINFGESCTSPLSEKKRSNYHRAYDSTIFEAINSACQLFREFSSGDQRLSHQELFGIATNMIQVQKGEEKFREILLEHSYYSQHQRYRKWDQDLRRIKGYKPYSCNGFCPYSDSCPHGKNILSTSKPKYHQMEKLANYPEPSCSVEEAYEDFNRNLLRFIRDDKPGWYILKSQTATGKTEAILKFLINTKLRVLIAVPTNKLKRELKKRAKKMGIYITVSPSLHELKDCLPSGVWGDIEALLTSGIPRMPYINEAIAERRECSDLFNQYKKDLEKFKKCTGHAITTHRNLLTMDTSDYDLVIVDEDIIFSSIIPNRTTINISDLNKLLKSVKKITANSPLAAKILKIFKCVNKEEFFTLKKIPYEKAYDDISMAVDISSLCSAVHFCYRKASDTENDLKEDCVTFVNPVKFNKNTKFIMVSATVSKDICEYCFGEDNVNFHECLKAKNQGVLNIYPGRSMSRSDMAKDIAIIERIKKWSGFKDTISFKKFMSHYTGDLHFGNCAGCDYLKGKDLDVIGTPHQPGWIYKLFAYSLERGIDVNAELKQNTTVTHNGYRFRFTTYDDMELRAIQFYMIESQSEQAVGRARLLRCDCTVNLFSSFPLNQAKIMDNFDYDND